MLMRDEPVTLIEGEEVIDNVLKEIAESDLAVRLESLRGRLNMELKPCPTFLVPRCITPVVPRGSSTSEPISRENGVSMSGWSDLASDEIYRSRP